MKCPHCLRPSKAAVQETRQIGDDIYRRRVCGRCHRPFVSREFTTPDLRLPRARTEEQKAARRASDRAKFSQADHLTKHLGSTWK